MIRKTHKEVLYRVAHIILVQEFGNKVFIVREYPPNSSLYTTYLFIIDNNSNKIKMYSKLVDYLKNLKMIQVYLKLLEKYYIINDIIKIR